MSLSSMGNNNSDEPTAFNLLSSVRLCNFDQQKCRNNGEMEGMMNDEEEEEEDDQREEDEEADRSANDDEEEEEHGDEDSNSRTEEQIGEEDLHFLPSLVCWSRPLHTLQKFDEPLSTAVPTTHISNVPSSVDAVDGGVAAAAHFDDEQQQQQQQLQPNGGESMFEQIAKLVGMENFENGTDSGVGAANSNGDQLLPNGQHRRQQHNVVEATGEDGHELVARQSPTIVHEEDDDDEAVEQQHQQQQTKNWTPSSTTTPSTSSSSARRKSFNPVRIKEDLAPQEGKNGAADDGHQKQGDSAKQHQQHAHAFTKRHDESEEGADDEQMGPAQPQQMIKASSLFMDDGNNSMVTISSTNPLHAFINFAPQLFPLEAAEEESEGLLHKEADNNNTLVQKQQQPHHNLGYFARFLKNELAGACAGAVDKVVGDFSTSSSTSSISTESPMDQQNIDEQQYTTQQQHHQQNTATVQHQHLQQLQAVQTRLWTAALALAASRQQQQQHQPMPTADQQQPSSLEPPTSAVGTCRPSPVAPSPFTVPSSVPLQQQAPLTTATLRAMPTLAATPFPWFSSVPSMHHHQPMNTAAFVTLFAAAQHNPFFHTAIGAFLSNAAAQSNANATTAPRGGGGGGIFPPPPAPTQPSASTAPADQQHNLASAACNAAVSAQSSPNDTQHHSHHNYPLRLSQRSSVDYDDSPRKKRAKVTDCVRGPRSSLHREFAAFSAANNPTHQLATNADVVPPTMVPSMHNTHARLLGIRCAATNKNNEDDNNGFGKVSAGDELATISINPHRTTLTHMHLRKAKLMFFYQRYPSSSLLKSYFPDVHFTKHNTAQLVKWFSNFREFFYMQMEKYAKQALAEGISRAEEIFVSTDSEVFKQLQQHYNKNNAFQPPEHLLFVIQETLREFYNALKQGRDAEPSWKKAIYKVIQQHDEPIPEFFREPQFVELLEQN